MEPRAGDWDPEPLLRETRWMRALALRLVQDVARADDLVQETLVAAIQGRPGTDRPLRPWLARVLRNRWASERRGEARGRAREEDGARSEELPSSVELLERAEVHRQLVEALTRLREPYRSVLLLRFYEDLEPAEIARRRGLPAATVRSQLRRGLAELRTRLDQRHVDRRSWSLALVPFAARARGAPLASPHALGGLPVMMIATAAVVSVSIAVSWPGSGPADSRPALSASEVGAGPPPGELAASAATPRQDAGAAVTETAAPRRSLAAPAASRQGGDPPQDSQDAGIFEGSLVHAGSGEPLAHFAFDLQREGAAPERIVTDGEGRFRSSRPWAAGPILLDFLDHPDLDGIARCGAAELAIGMSLIATSWDPARAPLELKAVAGAAYPLELSAGDPAVAMALAEGSLELAGTLRAADEGAEPPFAEVWHFRAPLRTEGGHWLRFSPTLGVLPGDRPWLVGLQSPDGLLGAEAEVSPGDAGLPPSQGRLALVLEARARLDVALLSAAEFAAPRVTIRGGEWHRPLDAIERLVRPDGRREHLFRGAALRAGAYELLVRCEGFELVEQNVTLVAGEVAPVEIVLAPSASASHVAGELRSDSGSFQERMFVRLRDSRDRPVGVLQPKWREVDDRWVAPFRFDHLDPGEYRLDLRSSLSNRRWSPASLAVAPPADDLVLSVHDEEPAHDLVFRVRDASSGEAIEDFAVTTWLEGCAPSMTEVRSALDKVLAQVADGAPVEWFAHAPGHAPAWGDRTALAPDGERFLADIPLGPGWGGRILASALAEAGTRPLAGVEVLLDGVLAGVTDARGRLDLVRDAAPASVELRHPQALFAGGDHDPDAGSLTGSGGVHALRFESN